jgi:hypothetical protein
LRSCGHFQTARSIFSVCLFNSLHPGKEAGMIEGQVKLPDRNAPKKAWLVVRTPSGRIEEVMINGQRWNRIDSRLEAVELPVSAEPLTIQVRYEK